MWDFAKNREWRQDEGSGAHDVFINEHDDGAMNLLLNNDNDFPVDVVWCVCLAASCLPSVQASTDAKEAGSIHAAA